MWVLNFIFYCLILALPLALVVNNSLDSLFIIKASNIDYQIFTSNSNSINCINHSYLSPESGFLKISGNNINSTIATNSIKF